MSKAIAIVALACLIIAGTVGGLYLYSNYVSDETGKVADTLTIKFTAMDQLAGERDADTTMIDIYMDIDGEPTKQETVTLDAAQKESANVYTTNDILELHIYDSTDTSLCTLYRDVKVPYASWAEQNDGSFQLKMFTVDRGDTAKDILIQYANNTAIADSATLDVTNESWDTTYAELDLEIRALNDDTGYWNTDNFLRNYGNNHYLVMKASGTGWDSVNLISSGWKSFDKASARYFYKLLGDKDLTRDLKAVGEYDPDGRLTYGLSFDLTGFEASDSVTFAYEYRWYSCVEYFQEGGSWGVNSAATSESVTIQY